MEPLKYFVFNKEKDYRHGYSENILRTERGITLEEGNTPERGVFFSRILDAGEEGNDWHRAVIESEDHGDDSIRFYFYCSDSDRIAAEGRTWTWAELIRSDSIGADRKHELMQPYMAQRLLNPKDVLLTGAKGRYLWMEIQLFRQTGLAPQIQHMKIYAGNKSFLDYLPEIYRRENGSDFLRRYLSIFEAVYRDMDAQIRDASRQLDPEAAQPEFLNWMASWMGITAVHLWSGEKLRKLLGGFAKRSLTRGTREYMEFMIEAFTGEKPFLVEYPQIEEYRGREKEYRKLLRCYAHGPYEVNILIREEAVPTLREQQALMQVIEDAKPAQVDVRLIVLRPYIYLDQNVYIGINSSLGTWQKASLNGVTAIPSVVAANTEGKGDQK
ncbi:MAG: phage tail protein [Lachnospiraceae bacterium]|nr:phage tail protein [Lachnospiraceae bacterium]